jgi:hypothetical protein
MYGQHLQNACCFVNVCHIELLWILKIFAINVPTNRLTSNILTFYLVLVAKGNRSFSKMNSFSNSYIWVTPIVYICIYTHRYSVRKFLQQISMFSSQMNIYFGGTRTELNLSKAVALKSPCKPSFFQCPFEENLRKFEEKTGENNVRKMRTWTLVLKTLSSTKVQHIGFSEACV